jgi:Asp-tRNA(Asn)/Glu-tRNA(Gln) amidotransferase A subunit family amidase
MPPPWNELSAIEAAAAIAQGVLTSEQLVLACFERIDARDRKLQAWAAVDRDRALAEARAADHTPRRSPLHGVPVGIKDVIDTADYDTSYNSPIYIGHRPKADAACVSLLKQAGCVILGKTVTTEFANIAPAHTRNPHNLERSPGGSSSGSAAAVADFMVPLALGTQTAGSTIRPASYCGAFAIKPTLGAVSRVGVKTLAETLDTIGLFARSPDDLTALLELLSGWSAPSLPDRAPRIGIFRTAHRHLLEPETASAIEGVAALLRSETAYVFDLDLAPAIDELSDDHAVIMGYESARALAWELAVHPDKISAALAQRLQAGRSVTRPAYDVIMAKAAAARTAMARVFESCDVLLTPSCAGEAPPFGTTGDSKFNRTWTLLGNPCVAMPIGKGASGLPLGMQLVGPVGHDMELLAWAAWMNERLFNNNGS